MADIQTLLDQRADAWGRRDPAALAASYSEGAIVSSPMFPHTEGRVAIERSFASLFRIFPDWDISFEPPCVSGDRAMHPCKVRATHWGDFMGIPGTGRRVEFECVLIYDLEDGLILRERRIYDFTGMLIQLGILKSKLAV